MNELLLGEKINFSETSFHALRMAAGFALLNDAEICVLHVGTTPLSKSSLAESEAVQRAAAISTLCRVVEEQLPKNVQCRPLLKSGEPASEIAHVAREESSDVIMRIAHGSADLQDADKLGSVAAEVLKLATCPVIILNGRTVVKLAERSVNGHIH